MLCKVLNDILVPVDLRSTALYNHLQERDNTAVKQGICLKCRILTYKEKEGGKAKI